jgi:chemotaxis protein MotB
VSLFFPKILFFGGGLMWSFNFNLRLMPILTLFLALSFFSGCATTKTTSSNGNNNFQRLNQEQASTIQALKQEIARLNSELDNLASTSSELVAAKADLEKSFQNEMSTGNVGVSMQARGLVVTVLDRVLFDSGKAELKSSSMTTLDKVIEILSDKVADNRVFVEGHTDNEPIRYSKWKSNWELSTYRALEVLHYFVKEKIDPKRVAAVGYGEYKPISDNASATGRGKNRRVEIVISPQKMS